MSTSTDTALAALLNHRIRKVAHTAAQVLSAAYVGEQLCTWLLPTHRTRQGKLLRWCRLSLLTSGGCLLAMTSDQQAAGRWDWVEAPDSGWPSSGVLPSAQLAILGDSGMHRLGVLIEEQRHWRPVVPHLRLSWLGVMPGARLAGRASSLLSHGLHHADRLRRPVYLETSSQSAARLYRRWGFYDTGSISLPYGGPTLLRMIRNPAK